MVKVMDDYPTIEAEYLAARDTRSDMSGHMRTLYELARGCGSVVEGGVRYVVSTWAFILGCACRGGTVTSYCWNMLPEIQRAKDICKDAGVPWTFHEGDWLKRTIPPADLLFIDTNHFYWQLSEELQRHSPQARKYIVLHDTTHFGEVSQDGSTPGLWRAVEEFVAGSPWRIKHRYTHCNGLTILENPSCE